MCGIAGIVAPRSPDREAALERMVGALRHRGPDGAGIHWFGQCGLGHTRLSIVDLSTGNQPMVTKDGQRAVTFNGEIYGYREVKQQLPGYEFQTSSDTEVILALHQCRGEHFLQQLPGMFAFAIWDESSQTLTAARDRFGEKPFYFAWGQQGEFLFASEIKALLASALFLPRMDRNALGHYLRRLYIDPRQTVYQNIQTLPPAHRLRLQEGRITIDKYWELPPVKEPISTADAVAEFKRLFHNAVARQLVADVPVAAFLSGGLDSSSIVAVAAQIHPRLKTLAFGFGEANNELPYARNMAQLYETEHTEVEARGEDIGDLLLEMARVYDEPFADSSNIPTYLISRAARKQSKVVLTGDGGDELLAGYPFWYRPLFEMEQASHISSAIAPLLRGIGKLLANLHLPSSPRWQSLARGARLRRLHPSIAEAHLAQNSFFSHLELQQLGLPSPGSPRPEAVSPCRTDTVDEALRIDLLSYLPGDILVKTDRAAMAHGLELRAPFLDVDLASFCISLPSRLKLTESEDKWILRHSFSEYWTPDVRRRGKQGFGAPVEIWLRLKSVQALRQRVFENANHPLFSVINFPAARPFITAGNYQTWSLLVLGLWLERTTAGSL